MYVPRIVDNLEWNIGCIQLNCDFPVEYATILNTSRHICIQTESVQKPFKLKDVFSTMSATVNKLLSEIGDTNRITISQESYFLYNVSNIAKETFISELDKKYINIWFNLFS